MGACMAHRDGRTRRVQRARRGRGGAVRRVVDRAAAQAGGQIWAPMTKSMKHGKGIQSGCRVARGLPAARARAVPIRGRIVRR